MRLNEATRTVERGIEETLAYYDFPSEHWRHIRASNVIERVNRASAQAMQCCRQPSPMGASSANASLCEAHAQTCSDWGKRKNIHSQRSSLEATLRNSSGMERLNMAAEETQQGL